MAATAPTIKKIIEHHLQEFGFLWGQRAAALRSPDWRLPDVKRLDGRIAAHLDGLRIAAQADPAAMAAKLKCEDAWAVFAAAVALLQLRSPEAAGEVVRALLKAEPEQIDAVRRALLHGPIDLIEEQLRAAADSAPPAVAAAAIEALLHHGGKNVKTQRLPEIARHDDPAVRCAAWRIVALSEEPATQ